MSMWFISTGFNGRNEKEIKDDISRGIQLLQTKVFDRTVDSLMIILDGMIVNSTPRINPLSFSYSQTPSRTQNIANDIYIIGQCDGILFMKDWKKYRGCRIEHFVAEEYGIKILYEEDLEK